jgi:hypothetical protein
MKQRYIPENSVECHYPHADATTYTYERRDKFITLAYSGKRSKPDFHYNFKTHEEREAYTLKWIERLHEIKNEKETRRKARLAFRHDLKVGDIFIWSWGWEQTNVDFYQIIELVGQTIVKVRALKQKMVESEGYSSMAGMTTAIKDDFYDDEILIKKVSKGNYIRMAAYGSASLWDGKPAYTSWYG